MLVDLPLIKSLLLPLAKIDLVPLGLTAAASAIDVFIQNNIFGSETTTLTMSNKEFGYMM